MSRTRVETRARSRALQALYAWDLRPGANLDKIATQIWDDLAIDPEERKLASALIRTFIARQATIDKALTDITTNWRLERLGVIDRCVLRMGAAELEREETPPRVVIQEAVTLAERYSGVRSAKFVNGVLDALARRMGRIGRSEE
jgi:N utilization substance protein B